MTDVANSTGMKVVRSRFRWIWLAPIFAFFALGAWVFASPVGASPDDDYHLASIWCANESRPDLCAPDPAGDNARLTIRDLIRAPCFVADDTASAACQEWSSDPAPTYSVTHGNWNGAYPPVYYAAMSVFASTDIQMSAITIRFINVLLFLTLTTALAVLLPANLKVPLVAGWMITVVPLGGYLIASNNPGAWAVIGVGSSWLAALGWFQSHGRRSWLLGGLTAFGVLIASGARTEAAVYSILGLGIAAFLAFARTRTYALKLLLPVALAVIAIIFFSSSGYSGIATRGLTAGIPDSGSRDPAAILAFNLISIPQLWTGIFGSWGLGWRMEIWPGFAMVEFATLVVFIGLASLGFRAMLPRKAVMVGALVGTLYLLPVYILTIGSSVVSENVQPRYILPLVVVLGGLVLITGSLDSVRPGPWHIIPGIVLLAGANSLALYMNLRRYITGFDVQHLSLASGPEWWWSGFPVDPMALWLLGTAAFAATVTILGIAWLRRPGHVGAAA